MRVIRAEQLTRTTGDHARLETHCTHTARCAIAGVTIELCTDIPEVARIFALRYADQPADAPADFRIFAATVRGGYLFWSAHAAAWRWTQGPLPADAVVFLADSVALSALVRHDQSLASFHGAALQFKEWGAIVAGVSNAARVGALFACVRRGMRLYSDERALLRGTHLQPLLRRSSTRAAGARLLISERDNAGSPASLPQLSLLTAFGSTAVAKPAPLRVLFVAAGTGYCAGLEAIDTATALSSVVARFDARGDMVDRVARAIAILHDVRCYKLTLGSPDESAAAIAYAMNRIA